MPLVRFYHYYDVVSHSMYQYLLLLKKLKTNCPDDDDCGAADDDFANTST